MGHHLQCDQIGQFIALWATFQSLWQQLFCPNCVTALDKFFKGVKIFHFSSEIVFGQLLQIFGYFLLVTLITCLFFIYFRLFKQTSLQFLQQIYVKNVHPVYGAGIQTQDPQDMSLLP